MRPNPDTHLPVSVLIATYNRAALLERALRSISAQRPRRPAQVIVVDDGSTDETAQVAEAHGAELIRHGRNLGAAAGLKTGLGAVRHEWVAWLDDDDEWLPDHLDLVWSLTPGSVLVASSCIERTRGSTRHFFHGPMTARETTVELPSELLHPENPIPASAAMFRNDAANAVGGFRPVLCEDLDLWCRLLSQGKATLSPRVTVLYHTHPGQMTDNWEAIHAAHLNIARSFAPPAVVERRAGVTAWDRFRAARRAGLNGAWRRFARDLLEHPVRALGVLEVVRHRAAVRRRTSRLALGGEPSVAVLAGSDPKVVPEPDRYEADLSATNSFRAFLRLARRPSTAAVVSSRSQAALVRLAGARPVRGSELAASHRQDGSDPASGQSANGEPGVRAVA